MTMTYQEAEIQKNLHSDQLLRLKGVSGIGVTKEPKGNEGSFKLIVFLAGNISEDLMAKIRAELANVEFQTFVTQPATTY